MPRKKKSDMEMVFPEHVGLVVYKTENKKFDDDESEALRFYYRPNFQLFLNKENNDGINLATAIIARTLEEAVEISVEYIFNMFGEECLLDGALLIDYDEIKKESYIEEFSVSEIIDNIREIDEIMAEDEEEVSNRVYH